LYFVNIEIAEKPGGLLGLDDPLKLVYDMSFIWLQSIGIGSLPLV
jgi:hypothetical protein